MSLIPKQHRAGISFEVIESLPAYPLPTWAVTLHLRGPSNNDIVAVDIDGDHVFSVADTSPWNPGKHSWFLWAVNGSKTVEVCTGHIEILKSISSINEGDDQRDHLDKVIGDLELLIERRITGGGVTAYELETERARKFQFEPLEVLQKLLAQYSNQRARKNRKLSGKSPFKSINVRFTR